MIIYSKIFMDSINKKRSNINGNLHVFTVPICQVYHVVSAYQRYSSMTQREAWYRSFLTWPDAILCNTYFDYIERFGGALLNRFIQFQMPYRRFIITSWKYAYHFMKRCLSRYPGERVRLWWSGLRYRLSMFFIYTLVILSRCTKHFVEVIS